VTDSPYTEVKEIIAWVVQADNYDAALAIVRGKSTEPEQKGSFDGRRHG
jgi:hypothetical protein